MTKAAEPIEFDLKLRTSERTMFNRCRMQHHFAYNLRLKTKREAPALRFGTLIHSALERYYTPVPTKSKRKRIHPAVTFETLYKEELSKTQREWPQWRDDNDEWHEYLELGVAMLTGYVERWSAQDDEYVTLATEQTFAYPIEPEPTRLSPRIYVGTFDRILYHRPTRRLLLGDYKTTKSDPTKVSHLILDEQAGAYWAIAPLWLSQGAPTALKRKIDRRLRVLPPSIRRNVVDDDGRLRFDGILYDFLRKGLPDARPKDKEGHSLNQNGTVSKQQPAPRYHRETIYRNAAESLAVFNRISQDADEIGKVRAGELALKKSPDFFHCFGGETRILTIKGVYSLSELVGEHIKIVNRYGQWESATVKCFGKQPLLKVTLDDGSVIRATPEHRWWKMETKQGSTKQTDERITTIKLDRVPIVKAYNGTRNGDRMYRDVLSIENDVTEVVYCAVVPGSESFVLANGVATSNCQMCSFKDICELHETGSDWEAMAKVTMTQWDPYSQHEVENDAHEAQAGMQR